jgi:hypothetical protein
MDARVRAARRERLKPGLIEKSPRAVYVPSKMKRSSVILAAVAVLFLIASCSTVPLSQRENAVERLVETINEQSTEELSELMRVPFLVDRELVETASDAERFWESAYANGFRLSNAEIVSVEPVTESNFDRFGSTLELRVYRDKYLAEDGAIATVRTDDGTFHLLVGDRRFFTPEFFGITGPE